MLLLLLIDVNR